MHTQEFDLSPIETVYKMCSTYIMHKMLWVTFISKIPRFIISTPFSLCKLAISLKKWVIFLIYFITSCNYKSFNVYVIVFLCDLIDTFEWEARFTLIIIKMGNVMLMKQQSADMYFDQNITSIGS